MSCTAITIEVKNYRCFSDAYPLKFTLQTSDCISFIGVNNSGKSTALKFIYEFRNLFLHITSAEIWKSIFKSKRIEINLTGLLDHNDIFNFHNKSPLSIKLDFAYDSNKSGVLESLELVLDRNSFNGSNPILIPKYWKLYSGIRVEDALSNVTVEKDNITVSAKLKEQQLPILDVSSFSDILHLLGKSIYIGAFRNAINTGTKDYFDLRVGTSFVEDWNRWKGGDSTQQNLQIIEVIEEIKELLDLKSLSIDSNDKRTSLKITYNGKPYKLEDVGSGIAQIIVILGNILIKNPRLILIDEPELNLHPSLQLSFLKLLEKHSECILFSTHSIGLARSASTKIYTIKKNDTHSIMTSWEGLKNLVEFAGELSFSSLKEIGCEKILLVEGPSELKSFQTLLRLLGKEKQFLILPLGGGSLISNQFEQIALELTRLSPNIFSIIDSEKSKEDEDLKRNIQDFKKICDSSKIECHILERRSFENYLSSDHIAKFKDIEVSKMPRLNPYDKVPDKIPGGWNKNNNWKIIQSMGLEGIKDTDLLNFINKI